MPRIGELGAATERVVAGALDVAGEPLEAQVPVEAGAARWAFLNPENELGGAKPVCRRLPWPPSPAGAWLGWPEPSTPPARPAMAGRTWRNVGETRP